MMSVSRRFAVVSALALLGLASCRSAPLPPPAAPIDYSAFPPIQLNVASITVNDAHKPAPGSIDGQLPVQPADAARRWAEQRLQAVGSAGKVRVTVTEASVVAEALAVSGGIQGYFTNEQAVRYNGRLSVEINGEVLGEKTIRASTRATATATATASEKSSLAEREAVQRDLVKSLADSLNARLDAGIRKDMAPLVVR